MIKRTNRDSLIFERCDIKKLLISSNHKQLQSRFEWIDTAKGFCIALVVLGHTVEWYMRNFAGNNKIILYYLNDAFIPLRMPLFFAISGILAARKMDRPLAYILNNTAGLYILYCIWTAIYCLKLALPDGRDGLPYPEFSQILASFLFPVGLWYIWALPAYYLLARGIQALFGSKSQFLIFPMILLAVYAKPIGDLTQTIVRPPLDPVHTEAMLYNLVWFYLGLKCKAICIWIVDNAKAHGFAAAAGGYAILWCISLQIDPPGYLEVLSTLVALWASFELLGLINHSLLPVRVFRAIGSKTLPIYVGHTFVLTGLTWIVKVSGVSRIITRDEILPEIMVPLVITLAVIILTRYMGQFLEGIQILRYLVEPIPAPFGILSWLGGARQRSRYRRAT